MRAGVLVHTPPGQGIPGQYDECQRSPERRPYESACNRLRPLRNRSVSQGETSVREIFDLPTFEAGDAPARPPVGDAPPPAGVRASVRSFTRLPKIIQPARSLASSGCAGARRRPVDHVRRTGETSKTLGQWEHPICTATAQTRLSMRLGATGSPPDSFDAAAFRAADGNPRAASGSDDRSTKRYGRGVEVESPQPPVLTIATADRFRPLRGLAQSDRQFRRFGHFCPRTQLSQRDVQRFTFAYFPARPSGHQVKRVAFAYPP